MSNMPNEANPADVTRSSESSRAGEIDLIPWDWVERSVWTIRMLKALVRGVQGGAWPSLADPVCKGLAHPRWPNALFQAHGLFCLEDARVAVLQSARG